VPFQAGPESVDEHARRPQASQFHDRGRPQSDARPERHPLELKVRRRDIFAEISRADDVATCPQRVEKLERYQVDLTQVGEARLPAGQIPVLDEGSGVSVAFDAVAFYQQDVVLSAFAEVMPLVGRHGCHRAFENEIAHRRLRPHGRTSAVAGEDIV
jgi:hypothetical protein